MSPPAFLFAVKPSAPLVRIVNKGIIKGRCRMYNSGDIIFQIIMLLMLAGFITAVVLIVKGFFQRSKQLDRIEKLLVEMKNRGKD